MQHRRNRICKGSNDKVIFCHCGKPVHTKEKIFKFIGYPKNQEYRIICFKYNETGYIAIDCPKNNENRNYDGRESNADINGIFIGDIICEPRDDYEREIHFSNMITVIIIICQYC